MQSTSSRRFRSALRRPATVALSLAAALAVGVSGAVVPALAAEESQSGQPQVASADVAQSDRTEVPEEVVETEVPTGSQDDSQPAEETEVAPEAAPATEVTGTRSALDAVGPQANTPLSYTTFPVNGGYDCGGTPTAGMASLTGGPRSGQADIPTIARVSSEDYCVVAVGRSSFSGTSGLVLFSFESDSQVIEIQDYASDGSGIYTIEVPKTVGEIMRYAFSGTPNLRTVTFQSGSKLSIIDEGAFQSSAFASITLPASISKIGANAFGTSPKLETVWFEGSAAPATVGANAIPANVVLMVPAGSLASYSAKFPDHRIAEYGQATSDIVAARTVVTIGGASQTIEGTIDAERKIVDLEIPAGVPVTALSPTLIHNGKSINPESGAEADFTNPRTYTVTADNGSTSEWQVYARNSKAISAEIPQTQTFTAAGPTTIAIPVTNTGHLPVDVQVWRKTGDTTWVKISDVDVQLAAGASAEISGTFDITEAQLDAGSFTEDLEVRMVGQTKGAAGGTVTYTRQDLPQIELTTATGTDIEEWPWQQVFFEGQPLKISGTVENKGNVSLDVQLKLDSQTAGTPVEVPRGQPGTLTADGTVPAAWLGVAAPQATATAESSTDPDVKDTEELIYTTVTPPFTVTSAPADASQSFKKVGDKVSFTYTVTNSSPFEVPVTVTGSRIGTALSADVPAKDASGDGTWTSDPIEYEVTAADIEAGEVVADMQVLAKRNPTPVEGGEGKVAKTVDRTMQVVGIDYDYPDGREFSYPGDVVTARVSVANVGNVPQDISVTPTGGVATDPVTVGWNPAGEGGNTAVFEVPYTVTVADVDNQKKSIAYVASADRAVDVSSDPMDLTFVEDHAVKVTGVTWNEPSFFFEGQEVTGTIEVLNAGNVKLQVEGGFGSASAGSPVTVDWYQSGDGSRANTAMIPFTYVISKQEAEAQKAIEPTFFAREVGTADSSTMAKQLAYGSAILPTVAAKTDSGKADYREGETISLTYTLTSAHARYGATGTAQLIGDVSETQEIEVEAAKSATFTVDHKVTKADMDRGTITVQAAIDGNVEVPTRMRASGPGAFSAVSEPLVLTAVQPAVIHSVTFDAQGGTPVPAVQNVEDGKTAAIPDPAPTREGYRLTGWALDAEGAKPFDFATPVTADITLYAQWAIVPAPNPNPGTTSPAKRGGTAATGADVAGLSAAAMLALAGGVILANRRRSS